MPWIIQLSHISKAQGHPSDLSREGETMGMGLGLKGTVHKIATKPSETSRGGVEADLIFIGILHNRSELGDSRLNPSYT